MVEAGAAVVYDQYLDSCGANANALLAAEEQAQAESVGVWSDPLFVLPCLDGDDDGEACESLR